MDEYLARKIKQANIEYYSKKAKDYDFADPEKQFSEANKQRVRCNLIKISKATNRGRLLDIGSGTGFISKLASPYFDEIYALDSSREMLEVQKRKKIPNVKMAVGDAEKLPFDSNYFDVCTTYSVLHHLPSLEPAFREIYRVLKPGGIYYNDQDPNRFFEKGIYRIAKLFMRSKDELSTDAEILNLAEYYAMHGGISPSFLEAALKKAGFTKVKIEYYDFAFRNFINKILGNRSDCFIRLLNHPPFNKLFFAKIKFEARK